MREDENPHQNKHHTTKKHAYDKKPKIKTETVLEIARTEDGTKNKKRKNKKRKPGWRMGGNKKNEKKKTRQKKNNTHTQRDGNMLEAEKERKPLLLFFFFCLLTPEGRSCGREYHAVFLEYMLKYTTER